MPKNKTRGAQVRSGVPRRERSNDLPTRNSTLAANDLAKWTRDGVLELIRNPDTPVEQLRALLHCLNGRQTADEQNRGSTADSNGAGFNKVHAPFLSSVARQSAARGYMTEKQAHSVRKLLPTYSGQLAEALNTGEVVLNEMVCPSNPDPASTEDEAEKWPKRPAPGVVHGAFMAEMIATEDGKLMFAVNSDPPVRDELELTNQKEILVPLRVERFLETHSLQLPSGIERGATTEDVICHVMAFLMTWADVPQEWLEPIAHYVVMTWVYDRFTAVPYLRFLGEHGTGKTRMLQITASSSYRSLAVSGNITGAAMFRSIDLIRGTVAIDEADFKTSAEWSDITKVLNNGYTPGFPIVRCDGADGTFIPQTFYVYGPKILSTRHRFDDNALESQCLTFETQERKVKRRIPLQLPPKFYQEARELRNKLLGWRFANFWSIETDDSMLRELDGRIGQVGTSLLAVAPDKEVMVSYLNGYAQSTKDDSPKEIVRQILAEGGKGRLLVAEVTRIANQRLEGSGLNPLTYKAVGRIVHSLGWKTRRTNTGYIIEKR